MNQRENLLSLLKREGFEYIPPQFSLCPHLVDVFRQKTGESRPYEGYFAMPWSSIPDIVLPDTTGNFLPWYGKLKKGTYIDVWGVAHEPGSAAAMHMTRMIHPLKGVDDLGKIKDFPFPSFAKGNSTGQEAVVCTIHKDGLAAVGWMQMTIWETAWYIRGMEDLMVDMMEDDPAAAFILDRITEEAVTRVQSYVKAGADIVYLGDDIGMQHSIMMNIELYRKWLKPRLKTVIDAAKKLNPDVIIMYHSCGYVTPFIDDLIEAGVNVLNPIQPESMDYREIVNGYKNRLSFHGCIGTQTVMPFGSPAEVKALVKDCLDISLPTGGMLPAPTHLLEPEVPWENIVAYVEACREYRV
jgi:uroporphyrinogen decarboxylase